MIVNLENQIIIITFANRNNLRLSIMCIDIVIRLKEFMKHVGMPSTQFADYAKIARPTISQLLNGRNRKVSNELISKLHEAFPELNILWLMFGDGDMINKTPVENVPPSPSLFPPTYPDRVATGEGAYRNQPLADDQQRTFANQRRENNIVTASGKDAADNYETPDQGSTASMQIPVSPNTDMKKRIKSIMVFYTDSSFEIFTPSDM